MTLELDQGNQLGEFDEAWYSLDAEMVCQDRLQLSMRCATLPRSKRKFSRIQPKEIDGVE